MNHQELLARIAAVAHEAGAAAMQVYATDFAVRGSLHGAPNLPTQMPIMVQVSRIDPLRGWLSFDFVRPADEDSANSVRGAAPSRE